MLPLERVRPGEAREGSEPLDWNLRNVYCIIVLMTVVKTLAGGCENVDSRDVLWILGNYTSCACIYAIRYFRWFYKILVLVCIWCILLMICIQFICRQLSSVFWHLLQFKLKLYNLSKQTYMKATTDIHKESPRGTASGMSRCHFFGWLLMSLLSFYYVRLGWNFNMLVSELWGVNWP